jgi:catechol 2,3-dioxygenase-like lactoylglutathione lyase family enzyme
MASRGVPRDLWTEADVQAQVWIGKGGFASQIAAHAHSLGVDVLLMKGFSGAGFIREAIAAEDERPLAQSARLLRDTRLVPSGPPPLFDHVALRVRDIARSRAFYERALKPLGVRVVQSSQGPLGFARDDQDLWIKEQETPGGPVHIAFAAPDRETVDAFHAAAVQAGGVDNGSPGLRPHYHSAYYAAFVLDPDGNNIEAVFHGDR